MKDGEALKWQGNSLNKEDLVVLNVTPAIFQHIKKELIKIEKVSFATPWTEKMFADEADNPASCFWGLYLRPETFIGYLCCWILAKEEMQLMKIAVTPEYRQRGYGKYLLAKLLEYGLSKDIKSVWLEVRESNIAARSLYHSCCFKDVGSRPGYYDNPKEDAILMTFYYI